MMKRCLITMSGAVLAVSAVLAQEKKIVPPPPKPPDDGPSLTVTMKFIQEKLNDRGKVSSLLTFHDVLSGADSGPYKFVWVLSEVAADAATCKLSWRDSVQDNPQFGGDIEFLAGDVTKIEVLPLKDVYRRLDAQRGQPERVADFEPPVYVVLLHVDESRDRKHSDADVRQVRHGQGELKFGDEESAQRLAKALLHAVELCGGGSKPEPF